MKLVYVAGPYTAANSWLVEQNIRRAENMAARVWGEGAAAICPHANARHMLEGVTTPEHALAGTMEMMRRCDAVILVDGWQMSTGSIYEVEEADRLNIPVFGRNGGGVQEFLAWIHDGDLPLRR